MTTASYRSSHQEEGHGAKYDSTLYAPGQYDANIWRMEKQILEKIVNRYYPGGIANYLDFACGTGRIISTLAPHASESMGLDISEEMLKVARQKIPDAKLIQGDITTQQGLMADTPAFDCITCFRFFLNAEPSLRSAALDAIFPLLAEGGYFICNNHGNSTSLLSLILLIKRWLGKSCQNKLPRREVIALLEDKGLNVIETYGVCFLPRICSRWLPSRIWVLLERSLAFLRIFNRFGIYQIYVAVKDPDRRAQPIELSL